MEEPASGIILRTRPLTETSLIVQWLTRDQGRIATVAKGARRPKSPFIGKLDLFYEADLSFVRSRRSELHALREVSLRNTHAPLRQDLNRLNAAAYCTVLLEQGTERETPLPEFYLLLREALDFLSQHPPNLGFLFALEARFLQLSGSTPGPEESSPAAEVLMTLCQEPFDRVTVPAALSRHLSAILRRGIGMTLEKLPLQRERLVQSLTN
jgi:DNA repair protein RecO (recombination protein O)